MVLDGYVSCVEGKKISALEWKSISRAERGQRGGRESFYCNQVMLIHTTFDASMFWYWVQEEQMVFKGSVDRWMEME